MQNLEIQSSSFSDGQEIPKKFGYKHGNTSPQISISQIPEGTQSLAMIMDDPDAQAAVGKVWVHWVVWNIDPKNQEFAEGSSPSGITQGKNDFGELGYGGPAPPDKQHTYIFKVFALDKILELPEGSIKSQLEDSMKNHVIAEGTLKGTYTPQ